MDAAAFGTVLTAVAGSGIIAALINFFANRKRVGADATKIITDAATSVVSSLRTRVEELEEREKERDSMIDEWRDLLQTHAPWDLAAVSALNKFAPQTHLAPPPPLYPRKRPITATRKEHDHD